MAELDKLIILVVEDEFYLARDLKGLLERAGAKILGPYPRESDALAALERQQSDCAVIDINTGSGPSFALADALMRRGVPFLFFTGYDRGAIPSRFSNVLRLEKPVGDARLVSALRDLCEACGPG